MRSLFVVSAFMALHCAPTMPHFRYDPDERGDPIVISERVGETIDSEERLQFSLFPGIADYRSATFYMISGYSYGVEIVTDKARFVSVNRDPNATYVLADYLDRHEEIRSSIKEFEDKWQIVGYDDIGQAITRHELNMIRHTRRNWLIGGGIGAVVGGLAGGAIGVTVAPEGSGMMDFSELNGAIIGCGIGSCIVGLGGGMLGMKYAPVVEQERAFDLIRQSRKPRVVEEY